MDINVLLALIQLAERAPKTAAEQLWLAQLTAQVQAEWNAKVARETAAAEPQKDER